MTDEFQNLRAPWSEGPDEDAPAESWLSLDDDEVLQRIESLDPAADADEPLLEVVRSTRHFFIRQEAAKRVRDRRALFAFEGDRHVGQILVRHLRRREDLTYLEKLASHSHYVEVRKAAQVQMAQVFVRLQMTEGPERGSEPRTEAPAMPATTAISGAVDGSLLGWAVHFVVEQVWSQLGTKLSGDLLRQTQQELRPGHPTLERFHVDPSAHVTLELAGDGRLHRDSVRGVAAWMASFLAAARRENREIGRVSVRQVTRLMADALEEAGFYSAFEEAELRRRV